jgi:hypothetical protein
MDSEGRYIGIPDAGVRVILKDESRQPENILNQYRLLSDVYAHYRRGDESPFFYAHAIIGSVDLVDIVTDSESPWAEPDKYHWILENARIFDAPMTGIRERAGVWNYTVNE